MKRKATQLFLFTVAVGLLVYLLHRIGFHTVGESIARVGWFGMAVLAATSVVESLFDGFALALAAGDKRALRMPFINAAGGVANQVLPFELGEALKVTLQSTFLERRKAVSSVVIWNYAFKLTRPLVATAAAIVGLIFGPKVTLVTAQGLMFACALSFAPYVLLRLVIRRNPATLIARVIHKMPFIHVDPEALHDAAAEVDATVRNFASHRPRAYVALLVCQVLARTCAWICMWLGMSFLGVDSRFGYASFVYGAVSVSDLFVSVLPLRFGVNEGATYGIFRMAGFDPALGIITYVVMRLKGLLGAGVMAPFAFIGGDARVATVPAEASVSVAPESQD